jgi:hypothetical protein
MTYARDLILTLTILSIIFIAANRPQPVKDNQTPYCVMDVYQGYKDQFGNLKTGWGKMYRPCSEQPDIYRDI